MRLKTNILFAADITTQRPDGYALKLALGGLPNRCQHLNTNSSRNAFDRKIDHDTPWRSGQDLGGSTAT
jgi:iron complex outermembrane receptor protein